MGVTTLPPETTTPPSPGPCVAPSGVTTCPPGRISVPSASATVPSVATV